MLSKQFIKIFLVSATIICAASITNSADAQQRRRAADRIEDVRDRREDVRDAKHNGGVLDRREDVRDRREDVRDRREDVRDRRHPRCPRRI